MLCRRNSINLASDDGDPSNNNLDPRSIFTINYVLIVHNESK